MNEARRKGHRLKFYDYSKANMYFITINTYNKQNVFGIVDNDKMILNDVGSKLNELFTTIFDNGKAEVMVYQIMPNHVHFILEIKHDGAIKLSSAIGYFKSICTKELGIKSLWARGYYDRVIRDEREYNNAFNYTINNPYRDKYKW